MSDRDTQFQGFAKALVDELMSLELVYAGVTIDSPSSMSRYYREEWEKIIARRAYDLVLHTVECVDMVDLARLFRQEIAERIPDMTELPKEQDDSASIYESLCNDEGVMQVAIQMAKAHNYDNFGRIIAFSEGAEMPKEQD